MLHVGYVVLFYVAPSHLKAANREQSMGSILYLGKECGIIGAHHGKVLYMG